MMQKPSVPIKQSVSAIDNSINKELNRKLVKALNEDEGKEFSRTKMFKTFKNYMPTHGQMISSSDEAIDDSEDEELPMVKEEDED
jgi:hypothetical protein